MRWVGPYRLWGWAGRGLLSLACAVLSVAPAQAAERPHEVLMLVPESAQMHPLASFIQAVMDEVVQADPGVHLQAEAVPLQVPWDDTMAWMRRRFVHTHFDTIVVFGATTVQFALALREQLYPGARLVFSGVAPSNAQRWADAREVYGRWMPDGIGPIFTLVRALYPDLRQLAIVGPQREDPLNPTFWDEVQRHRGAMPVVDLSGLPLDQLRQRIRTLPAGSVLALMGPAVDTDTGRYISRGVFQSLIALSSVPVFSGSADLHGAGIVGGSVGSDAGQLGREIGELVNRLWRSEGAPADEHQPRLHRDPPLHVDWRVMQRLDLPQDRLPAGTVVDFKPPSLWEAYRTPVLIGLSVLLLQSLLVLWLVVERQRRQRAQQEASQRLAELAHHQRVGAMGVLSLTLAHELNQPLGTVLSSAQTAEVLVARPEIPRHDVQAALQRIVKANRLASDILRTLQRMVRRSPEAAQALMFDDLVGEIGSLLTHEAARRGLRLALHLQAPGARVWAEPVQLQQVVLNLAFNAIEAMADVSARVSRDAGDDDVRIETGWDAPACQVHLRVLDRGAGLPPGSPERVFEAFFTTKPRGLGLGLGIARGLVQSHGGALQASHREGGGACFELTLPLAQPGHAVAQPGHAEAQPVHGAR